VVLAGQQDHGDLVDGGGLMAVSSTITAGTTTSTTGTGTTTSGSSGITALTGDGTASGTGSVSLVVTGASGDFAVTGKTTMNGKVAFPAGIQAISGASSTIPITYPSIRLSGSTSYTLTSAPTIADGVSGQVIRIINVGTGVFTLQDEAASGIATNLRLSAPTVALAQGDSIEVQWSPTLSMWVQIATTGAGAVKARHLAATGTAHAGVAHLGDDTWGLPMPSPSRFSLTEATATAFLAKADTTVVKELWLGDSMSSLRASDAEQTSVPAVYEAEMAEVFNLMPRGARGGTTELMGTGHVPVQMINAFAGAATQIKWDTVQGTAPYRGPAFSNRLLSSGQYCQVTRYGTAVTVFYTKSRDNAGTIQVTINGVAQTAINTRDAALSSAYDSGYSVTYARPGTSGAYGPMVVRVDCTAGVSDIESAYFHAQNSNAGHRLYRIDQSSQTIGGFSGADWFPQYVGRVLPHIVTIYMGHNDAVGGGVSASGLATRIETMVGVIRARYSTWLPAIRYVFQGESATSPSDWVTNYLPTLRAKCQSLGVAFLDTYTAQNSYRSTDYLDVIDADGLHPNDTGSRLIGQLVADWTKKTTRPNRRPFQVADHYQHVDLGVFGAIRMLAANGQNLVLGQWAGVGGGTAAATGSSQLLGQLLFYGAKNAYGDMTQGAGISAVAEALWVDGATYTTTLRIATTNGTTSSVKVGVTGSGTLFVGATLAGATAKITAAGAAEFTSLTVGGVAVAGGGRLAYVGTDGTVGNTSGTLTTIASYTVAVPAATLTNNGDSLLARYTFTTPAAGPYSPTFQVLLGGVIAVAQHTITTNAATAGAVVAEVEILRLSATTARCSVRLTFGSATGLGAAYKTMTSIPSLDSNSNDLVLKMSQGHTSPNDITATSLVVEVVRG